MKTTFCLLLALSVYARSQAQSDPEFPGGFIMHAKVHNGLSTAFKGSAEYFIGGLQLVPQVTVIENLLRAGVIADGYYTNKNLRAAFGPTLSFKLTTFKAGIFGSAGNLQLSADHLWGTSKQRLVGGGVAADLGNLVVFGLSAHRDYHFNTWWFQNSLGIRISKKKKINEPFNQ